MDSDTTRIARLEQQVDWLFAQAGYEPPNGTRPAPSDAPWPYPVSPAVLELAREGALIQAIKQQRVETSQGLGDAKDAVERAMDMVHRGL